MVRILWIRHTNPFVESVIAMKWLSGPVNRAFRLVQAATQTWLTCVEISCRCPICQRVPWHATEIVEEGKTGQRQGSTHELR